MSVGIMSCRAGLKSLMECVKVEFYPRTYFVYADKLSRMLNNVNASCFVGASLVNHLMYADDFGFTGPVCCRVVFVALCMLILWPRII